MSGVTAFIYHPSYQDRGFSPFTSVWQRYLFTLQMIQKLNMFGDKLVKYEQETADDETLSLVHSKEYIEYVKEMSKVGYGYLDYGDTPVFPGIFKRASVSVGGSVLGAKLIAEGKVLHAFNPGGGLHHAKRDSAAGFCVFNDIVIAVRYLQKFFSYKKIAIVDIDGHHADGTEELLYSEPILKISFHYFSPSFYPGTGSTSETGEGEGKGYCINVPLAAKTDDEMFIRKFKKVTEEALKKYKPEIILMQCGVDGHFRDPLVNLSLTTNAYKEAASFIHDLAHRLCSGKLLCFGGGGYNPKNVARCWTIITAEISKALPPEKEEEYRKIFD